jgi:hypothetical protein
MYFVCSTVNSFFLWLLGGRGAGSWSAGGSMMAKQIGRFCAQMTEEMTIKTLFSSQALLCHTMHYLSTQFIKGRPLVMLFR